MAADNGAQETAGRQYACTVCRVLYRSDYSRCPRDGGEVVAIDPGDDPLLGATLAERYVIEELIGQGGMGRVYRARHAELPRNFAIKILFGEYAALGDMRARFRMEAESAARLSHPNLVPVVDVGESEEGLLYLAMEYVAGANLGAIIDREAPLAPARAAALARRLCRGLQHAHDSGMVHRDFKPDNVIVVEEDGEEVPRIADFGLAVLTDEAGGPGRLTRKGETMGTPPYMSPEQLTGRAVDGRSDLFSLGVVLYEMLTGRTPFEGSVFEVVRQIATEPPPAMAARAPGVAVPAELERIARKLLATRPEDRYASAAEVIADLDAAATATAAPAPARASLSDTGELLALVTERRRPVVGIALAGAALAIAGIVLVLALRDHGGSDDAIAKASRAEPPAPAVVAPPVTPTAPPRPVTPTAPPPAPAPVAAAEPPPAAPARPPAAKVARKEKPRPPAAPSASADDLYREGARLHLNGRLAEAKKKYEAALAQDSRYPAAHRGLGFVHQRLGDRAKALRYLRRYLELAPHARDAGEVEKRIEALGG
jgi:hypothetical protein